VVQYSTTSQGAQRNRELIEDVLMELARRDPGGVQYQVLLLDDGVGFMHIVAFDGSADPFADCDAYREFHRDLAQRLATKPVVTRAALIGSYHGSP
jgi:dihydropteroate synthase